ncbi:MAG: A24 family peptidase [Nitrospirota bacterium]
MNMIFADTNILMLLTTILIIAVVNDLRFQKIPNILTFPAMVVAIAYNSWFSGLEGFLFSIEGIGLGMAVFIAFHLFGGMGAGDVKLMGAVGGFLGPKGVFIAFIFTAFTGGIYSLIILAYHGHLRGTLKRYGTMFKSYILTRKIVYVSASNKESKLRLCYGVPIAMGTLLTFLLKSFI